MRQLIFTTLIGFTLLLACSKDQSEDYYWGTTTAEFDQNTWEAKPYSMVNAPYKQGIDFLIHKFNKQGFQTENLFIYKVPEQIGRYPITKTEVRDIDSLVGAQFFTLLDGGDVLGDSYSLLDGVVENFIEITKIKDDQIWADFQVAFVRNGTNNSPSYPDTIVFTNGSIHTRLVPPK